MHEELKLVSPDDWQPFDEVYAAFAEANPMLGLNPSEYAATRVRQQYGERLLLAGVARKMPNRRWLASPRRFGPALFDAMSRRRAEVLAQATGKASTADALGPDGVPVP